MPVMAQSDQNQGCDECGAVVPPQFNSCRAVFEEVCALEYTNPPFGAVHLLTVDAYALQHSAERGPRSNAFHLMRLCLLLEHGHSPAIGQRPPRDKSKAFERQYRGLPHLEPPGDQSGLTIVDVHGAPTPDEHAGRVRRYARSVWDAWAAYHQWARGLARDTTFA